MQNQQSTPVTRSEAEEMARRARHPAERILSILSILLTVGILVFLIWIIAFSGRTEAEQTLFASQLAEYLDIDEPSAIVLVKSGAWGVLIIYVIIYVRYWLALFNEQNRADSEDLTCSDLISDEPKKIMEQYANILGMKKLPVLFFSDHGERVTIGNVVTYGKKYMVLSTFLNLERKVDERLPNLRFRLATKMGNIYMGYNNILFQVLTLPGRMIPIFKNFYIKSLVYSSDRMALEILAKDTTCAVSSEEVARFLFLRGFDEMVHPIMNVEQAMKNREERFNKQGRFDKALLRLTSEEPPMMDRISAVRDTSKYGPLI